MIDTERQANQNKRNFVWTFHAGETLKIYVDKQCYMISNGEPPPPALVPALAGS
jgi:hypothetical protein